MIDSQTQHARALSEIDKIRTLLQRNNQDVYVDTSLLVNYMNQLYWENAKLKKENERFMDYYNELI